MSTRKLLGTTCAVALMVGMVQTAQASEPTPPEYKRHWYVSVFGGWSNIQDHSFDFVNNITGAHFGYRVSLDDGYTVGGAFGLIVNNNTRIEIEVAHTRAKFSDNYAAVPPGFVGLNESGSIRVTTVMANIWFNTHIGHLSPYVGGGIGVGFVDGDLTISNGAGRQFDGKDTGLAFQVGAGVRIPLGTNLELDVGYRWKTVLDINFTSAIAGFSTTDDDISTHTVQAGLIWKF